MSELRDEVLQNEKREAEKTIIKAELAEKFYRRKSGEEKGKENAAQWAMKADKYKEEIKIRKDWIEFLNDQ